MEKLALEDVNLEGEPTEHSSTAAATIMETLL